MWKRKFEKQSRNILERNEVIENNLNIAPLLSHSVWTTFFNGIFLKMFK